GRMRIVAVERRLAGLGLAHGWPPAEPVVPAREVRRDAAPVILRKTEVGEAAGASHGDLAEIDIGAEVTAQLVEPPVAAVLPLHHLSNEARREFLLVLRRVALPQQLCAAHHLRFHDAAGRHRYDRQNMPAFAPALWTKAVIAERIVQVLADQRRL